jgi:assimilatory nitrate reductase catalytic subunit
VPDWRAFLLTQGEPAVPSGIWWSRSRVRGGWLYELAGTGDADVATLIPCGDQREAVDLARGMRRVTVAALDGTLVAALYLTRTGHLPGREWLGEQLGTARADGLELLAGRPSTPQPDRGAITCVCLGIGANAIRAAASAGATNVAAVGAATGAGTNCGSCRPAIARLLEQVLTRDEEAVA